MGIFTIIELMQKPMNQKLPNFPTHRLITSSIQTRGLARFLTFQVLCYIMVLLAMSVPSRTALGCISFAFFLDLTTYSFLKLLKEAKNK